MDDMIDITGADLSTLIRAAYSLSAPQGLGYLHHREGDLDDETVAAILDQGKDHDLFPVRMDYVHGRSIKLTVRRINNKLYIPSSWYDHSAQQLAELLVKISIERAD